MEWYIQSAWNFFTRILAWMNETTILSVAGINVTFLGLLITLAVFEILLWVIYEVLELAISIG